MNEKYRINQKILEITIDDCEIPFKNCHYKNIEIYFNYNPNSIQNHI